MDIASLGIKVDTSDMDKANDKLDAFEKNAAQAERAAGRMGDEIRDSTREGAKGAKELGDSADRMAGKLKLAASAGAAIGVGISAMASASVAAFAVMDRLIGQVADWQDLSEKIGTSASGLASMKMAMDGTSTSADSVVTSIAAMTRQIHSSNDESKGAAKALAAIGLEIEEFRKLKPDEAYRQLARTLSEYEEGQAKLAVTQAIVGRGAAEQMPFLNQLGAEQEKLIWLTDEQIKQADDYKDKQAEVRSSLEQLASVVAIGATPVLMALTQAFEDSVTQMIGVDKQATALKNNEAIFDWAQGVGRAFAMVITAGQSVAKIFQHIGKGLGSLMAAASAVLNANILDQDSLKRAGQAVRNIFSDYASDVQDIWSKTTFLDNFDKRMAQIRAEMAETGKVAKETKKQIDESYIVGSDKEGKTGKPKKTDAERAAEKALREAERERARQEKATHDQAMRDAKARQDARNKEYEQAAEFLQLIEQETVARRKAAEAAQSEHDARSLETDQDEINTIHERARLLEEEVRTHGMLKSAIEEEHLARLRADAASFEGNETALAQLEKRIEAQERLVAAVKGQETQQAVQNTADNMRRTFEKTWDQVGQSLTDAIINGGVTAKQLLERTFKAMVLRPAIQAVVSAVLGGVTGGASLAGAVGGGGGRGVTGALSGMSNMGGLLGSLGTFGSFAQTGLMNTVAGTGLMSSLSAGGSLVSGGAMAGGLGMIAGALAPIAIGVYGLYRLFGSRRGGPKVGGSHGPGISVGPDGGEMNQQAYQTSQTLLQQYQRLANALGGTNTAGISFGAGFSTDPRGTAPSFVEATAARNGNVFGHSVNLNVGRDEESLRAAIQTQTTDVLIAALRDSGIDGEIFSYFDRVSAGLDGAGRAAMLDQLPAIAQYKTAMDELSRVMPQLARLSLDGKVKLAEFAGGIEQLSASLGVFFQEFYTEQERRGMQARTIARQLNAAGMGWDEATVLSSNREQWRNIIESIDLTSESGQRLWATMVNLSGAFAELHPGEVAKDVITLEEAQDRLSDAYMRSKEAIEQTRDRMREWGNEIRQFRENLVTDETLSPLSQADRYAMAFQQYQHAVAQGLAGDETAQGRVQELANQFLQISRQMNASNAQYQNDFNRVVADMDRLQVVADAQMGRAEAQLVALDKQVGALIDIREILYSVDQGIQILTRVRGGEVIVEGNPHAMGLARVPFDNYPALLHANEAVLTPPQAAAWRDLGNLSGIMMDMLTELRALRRENREDAGNIVGATLDGASRVAEETSSKAVLSSNMAAYLARSKVALS